MVWKPAKRESKWHWRKFITAEELVVVQKIDKLSAELKSLQAQKTLIMNRAIQRAKYEASK